MKRILMVLTCMVCLLDTSYIYAESVKLEEIVVVATREREDIIRVPANVTVITAEDIEMSGVSQITELLRSEAGLTVTNTAGSTPTGITVEARGFNNGGGNGGRTLVLIDGRKANEADTSQPDWALVPLSNIERIEIIRGPATAIYGDSAMAAVINIITKKGKGKPSFEIGAKVGSWQRFGEKATIQGSTGKFGYFILGSHDEDDGYRDNSNFRSHDYAGKLSYQAVPELELFMKIGVHTHDRKLPGILTKDEIEAVGRRDSVTDEDEWKSDQMNIDWGFELTPDEYSRFSLLFYFNNNQSNSLVTSPGAGDSSIDDVEDDFSLSLKYASSYPLLGRQNKAIFGLDLLQEEVDSENLINFPISSFINEVNTSFKRRSLGIYLHNDFSITNNIIIGTGVRYDKAVFDFNSITNDLVTDTTSNIKGDRRFNKLSPRATATALLTDNTSAYLSYAKTFRFPNRDELTGVFGLTPELDPENGENYEVGLKTRLGNKFNGGISLYHLKVENEIIWNQVTSFANENFDEIIHKGIEVSMETGIIPGITTFGSYTLVDTEINKGPFEGARLPITPKHSGSIGANADLGYGFSLWNQARFVSKRFLANDLENTLDKLPGYGVWDAKLSYTYNNNKSGNISTFLGINNILDKEYEEFGAVGGFPFGSRIGFYPSPERNFAGGLTYTKEF